MKFLILISLLMANVALASEQIELDFGNSHCISLKEAKAKLTEYLGDKPFDTIEMDFPFIDEGELERMHNMPAPRYLKRVLRSLRYDKTFENYQTESLWSGYCAPAAECWGWYIVTCQGQVEARADGED